MSLERRLALIQWAAKNESWIVEDDYDVEFRYVGKPHAALMAIDAHQRVIYVGTFSKVLFQSMRLGYIISPPDLVDGFVAAHMSMDMHAHLIDQALSQISSIRGTFARHLRRMPVVQ
jgi:GntR family transcriptional regulator / MocR family aminotransferase